MTYEARWETVIILENEHLKLMTCEAKIIIAEEAIENVFYTRLSA